MYNHDAAPGFITVHQVSKDYSEGMTGPSVRVLSDVNLQIREGEFISLMGQSGSGKSTLLTILGGMNHPSGRNVLIDGIDVYGLSDERRADFRAEYLGLCFSSITSPVNASLAHRILHIADGYLAPAVAADNLLGAESA